MDAAQVQAQWSLVQALPGEGIALPADVRSLLAAQWMALGHLHEAERLLSLEGEAGPRDAQAQLWLKLALAHGARQSGDQQRLLAHLLQAFPDQPQATKARFLLDNL